MGRRRADLGRLADPGNDVVGQIDQHVFQFMGGQGGKGRFGLFRPVSRIALCCRQRIVFAQKHQRMVEIALFLFALFNGAHPKRALGLIGFGNGLDHWQGQFALAEIVADVFARGPCIALIIQQIVNDLEGDAKRVPIVCLLYTSDAADE